MSECRIFVNMENLLQFSSICFQERITLNLQFISSLCLETEMSVKPNLTCLYFIAFTDLFGVSLVVPLLSPYLKSIGASHSVIGLSGSIYAALQLISGPIIGSWSDIYGRLPVMIFTVAVCTFSYLSIGFTSSIVVILTMRILLGTFKHTQTLCKALAADIVPAELHSSVQGKLSAISGIGFIVGPVIGGHLAEIDNGYVYVFLLVGFLFSIIMVISYIFMKNHIQDNRHKKEKSAVPYTEFLKVFSELSHVDWVLYWDLFAVKFLLALSQSIFFSNYSLNMKELFDLTPKFIGYTISFIGMNGAIAGLSASILDSIYSKYSNPKFKPFHTFFLLSLSFLILGLTKTLSVYMLTLIPLSICFSLLRIISTNMAIERTTPENRGSLIGTLNSVNSLARLFGPLCSGIALDLMGYYGSSLLSVASSALGALISLLVMRKKEHKS